MAVLGDEVCYPSCKLCVKDSMQCGCFQMGEL